LDVLDIGYTNQPHEKLVNELAKCVVAKTLVDPKELCMPSTWIEAGTIMCIVPKGTQQAQKRRERAAPANIGTQVPGAAGTRTKERTESQMAKEKLEGPVVECPGVALNTVWTIDVLMRAAISCF